MRITGGDLRGRNLPKFHWKGTKPTTDKVRQALFNIFGPDFDPEGKRVLDCYAGTGIVSLEFISRGFKASVSLDVNKRCCDYMSSLKELLKLQDWQIVNRKVSSYLAAENGEFDVIFADPPYDEKEIEAIEQYIKLQLLKH